MKKQTTAILMVLSMLVGAGGTYAGMQLAQPDAKSDVSLVIPNKDTASASDEEMKKVQQAYELIKSRYVEKVDDDKLIEGAIQGMISTLNDPYSVYMDEETSQQFTQSLDSSFEGIGAEVSMIDGKVTIVAPIKNSPAEKAGLKPNDQILKVNGESLEGLDLYEAVLKIRGKKGTAVQLDILRPGVKEVIKVKVVRDEIPIETVYDSVETYNGKKVGYLEVTSFSENTAQDFKKKLSKLEAEHIDGLIIDVRGNPGGYLQSVEEILKQFIPKDKPYVQIEERDGDKQRFYSDLTKKKPYPIAVLIDKGSASASEILAGAMKEAGGYKLVGETSFGKGTVQQAIPMGDGSNIKLTLYKWLTPDGHWIHKKGIKPDVEVKQPDYFHVSPLHIEKTLAFDMNNEQIKNAQQMLKGLGFDPGRTDGYFSKKTEAAVKAFQKANKLPQTGKIDKNTAEVLQAKVMDAIRNKDHDVQLKTAMKVLFQ
ncbi:S41 family peptidase [Saccharococcus caldoxylosilyticus]|uniref:Carboxyl-terminal processing protease n=1 Tax=Parageobacillus caldoxylosilyticus NBRC 107762 TaxID=1220594 RepID=A0A023DID2_9BACL|nr:S41 family peptidase [Parageobacillus caldoxylosilyticus]MBB3854104.1 carboxyl-terminal processing protease [Parageobacillus caldoxylosilyticus]GAJ41040.1 carboxyl-terminal processing protease [Parageobacillus caldoxylosilyticus NBRC 107762]